MNSTLEFILELSLVALLAFGSVVVVFSLGCFFGRMLKGDK